MRLICPNCGAQYEVADDAIPPSGRDVQCSNCGHGWFQHPALSDMDEAEVVAAPVVAAAQPAMPEVELPVTMEPAPAEPEPAVEPVPETVAAVPEPAPEPVAETPPITSELAEAPPAMATEAAATPSQRNTLDDNLLAVLREEAEREVAQRKAESARGIETQTELGIEAAVAAAAAAAAPAPPPAAVPKSAGRAQDFSYLSSDADLDTTVPEASVRPAARRDLLPDVEVISSTLRSSSAGGDDDNPMPDLPNIRRSSGFRSGFLLSVLLAVIVVVAYVLAPRLAEQFPAAKGSLDAFVAAIDALRLWIGTVVANLTGMLESKG
jgi:predicted Zn finger-like uncharacterized protein